ncbi:hypothetical protein BDY21DRAFT_141683 [Lineolata rhizophorae]|uniref:Uncharacterized protein n=1 Tax=Lineolata rhizophorae TaxID=578093 RepID=A0A6A6NNA2_9PEZI|nr:hypothetical protein BDY21DRAFT_141683 [Lineolata rhizophorae]
MYPFISPTSTPCCTIAQCEHVGTLPKPDKATTVPSMVACLTAMPITTIMMPRGISVRETSRAHSSPTARLCSLPVETIASSRQRPSLGTVSFEEHCKVQLSVRALFPCATGWVLAARAPFPCPWRLCSPVESQLGRGPGRWPKGLTGLMLVRRTARLILMPDAPQHSVPQGEKVRAAEATALPRHCRILDTWPSTNKRIRFDPPWVATSFHLCRNLSKLDTA